MPSRLWARLTARAGRHFQCATLDKAAGDPDTGETYYRNGLATLERIVAEKGVTTSKALAQHYDAWGAGHRTPHGTPIQLKDEDFCR